MAYFSLIKLHRLPHEIFTLPEHELALIDAFVVENTKSEKKQATKLKRK